MNKYRKTCTKCGYENNIQHQFCSKCGEKLPPLTAEQIEDLQALKESLITSLTNAHRNYFDVAEQNADLLSKTLIAFSNHHGQLNNKPRLVYKKKFKEVANMLLNTITLISVAMPSPEPGNIEKKLEVVPGCQRLAQLCQEMDKTSITLRENYLQFLDNQQMVYQKNSKECLNKMASLFDQMADEVEKNL